MIKRVKRGLLAAVLSLPLLAVPAQGATANYNCGTSGTYQVDTATNRITSSTLCVGTLNIQSGITAIGSIAFQNNHNLTAVTIPASVQTIELSAFNGAYMNSLTLNEGLVTIENSAFANVYTNGNAISLTFPNSLTTIGQSAFSQSYFKGFSIGENVTSLAQSAFYNNFSEGATKITFRGSSKITQIFDYTFIGFQGSELILPESLTAIGNRPFEVAPNLTTMLIPSGVTSMGTQVLANLSALNTVVLPSGLATMGINAFQNDTNLRTVLYCGSTTAILNYAYPNSVVPVCARAAIFSANGGTGTMTPDTGTATKALKANTLNRSSYIFTGWNTKADGSGTSYADGANFPFTNSTILYAQWVIPDVTAPTFTSSKTISLAENTTLATSVIASEAVTITIFGGADQSKFSLARTQDSASALSFITAPNYESPTDIGADNTYIVVLKAQDLSANIKVDTFTITITNVADPIGLLGKTLPTTAVKGGSSTLTISVDAPSYGTFMAQGKKIAKCIKLSSTGTGPFTLTCTWKPTIQGGPNISLSLTPKGGTSTASSYSLGSVGISNRTTQR